MNNVNEQLENLVAYYIMERSTTFEGQVIRASRKFALECIVERYSKLGNQQELLNLAKAHLEAITEYDQYLKMLETV